MCIKPLKIKTYRTNEDGLIEEEIEVPCGKCILCRQKRVQDWTIKLINEAKYYDKCSFITLTFDDKIILDDTSKCNQYCKRKNKETGQMEYYIMSHMFPYDVYESKEYFKKFMKRLRKKIYPTKIKYFKISEYGTLRKRAHIHCIIFGYDFPDKREIEKSQKGQKQYMSEELTELWSAGRCTVSEVNNRTIGYVAGYSLKKTKYEEDTEGEFKAKKKNYVPRISKHKETGEEYLRWEYRYKPIMSFSNRGKIGTKWIRKRPEMLENGMLTDTDGHKYGIPKSYIKTLKESDQRKMREIAERYIEKKQEYIEEVGSELIKMRKKNKAEILKRRIEEINREIN